MEEDVCVWGERGVCVYIMNNGSGVFFFLGGGSIPRKGVLFP